MNGIKCECGDCLMSITIEKLREALENQGQLVEALKEKVAALEEALERSEDWAEDSDEEAEFLRTLIKEGGGEKAN